ncbi:MAG: T9SS type A sorting domain-containing protein [Bacteroidota bacterium]
MSVPIQAQTLTLERSVLANAGHLLQANEVNAAGRMLGFTLGEAVIGAETQSNAYLEEGFWAGGLFISPMTSIGGELYVNSRIQVYPNPAQTWINIEGEARLIDRVQLYDVRGRLVLDQDLQGSQISVETLTEGVYQLLTQDVEGNVTGTFKLVKW